MGWFSFLFFMFQQPSLKPRTEFRVIRKQKTLSRSRCVFFKTKKKKHLLPPELAGHKNPSKKKRFSRLGNFPRAHHFCSHSVGVSTLVPDNFCCAPCWGWWKNVTLWKVGLVTNPTIGDRSLGHELSHLTVLLYFTISLEIQNTLPVAVKTFFGVSVQPL